MLPAMYSLVRQTGDGQRTLEGFLLLAAWQKIKVQNIKLVLDKTARFATLQESIGNKAQTRYAQKTAIMRSE